ncbi:hypothetical protein SG34_010425 [Thalassomonas viridans]|uniref:Uncharacterized protein n=1 Tax=Thalassomonas viridans TaxID=137584 RepID=A0AAF0CB62_9GAMM|nr:hypothetical protein [Thalassomonas viridans]WDE07261.1 hypothetical protein SG34_010425 [Thalassomonas viridans]
MAKFNAELKQDFSIEFLEPEKSIACFIDGIWQKMNVDVDSLEELAAFMSVEIAKNLNNPWKDGLLPEYSLQIDGFPVFITDDPREVFETVNDDVCGKIRISDINHLEIENIIEVSF